MSASQTNRNNTQKIYQISSFCAFAEETWKKTRQQYTTQEKTKHIKKGAMFDNFHLEFMTSHCPSYKYFISLLWSDAWPWPCVWVNKWVCKREYEYVKLRYIHSKRIPCGYYEQQQQLPSSFGLSKGSSIEIYRPGTRKKRNVLRRERNSFFSLLNRCCCRCRCRSRCRCRWKKKKKMEKNNIENENKNQKPSIIVPQNRIKSMVHAIAYTLVINKTENRVV